MSRRPGRLLALFLSLIALVGTGLLNAPAQAAVNAPQGLTPFGESVQGIPVLTWDRVPGATSYDVQVASSSDFALVKYKITTTNRRVVPTVQLSAGEVWWRVKANSPSGGSDWSTVSFERDTLAGPTLLSPADGVTLDAPEDPALLAWTPVAGAVGYTIEIDDAPDFIEPTTYTTKTASYVVPNPQIATDYFWRVRASLAGGVISGFSEVRSYSLGGLDKPVLMSPVDSSLTEVEDVVLDWQPVVGAATYDLQISTDHNFNTIDASQTGIQGTRYSPPISLRNDQYYWRVRPVDIHKNQLAWSAVDVWQFRRHWPDQPDLEYPVGGAVVGDPFYYQWTPVDKADHYVVQLSPTGDFQDPVVTETCTTVHTTYTPGDEKHPGEDCYPGAMGTYSWRVIAYDGPRTGPEIQSDFISAEIETFSYKPETVLPQDMSPSHGATVQVPTLSWSGVEGASYYRVSITAIDGGAGGVVNAVTHSTSYTSRNLLTPGKTYRWSVQPVSGRGRLGPVLSVDSQPTFTVAAMPVATATTPVPVAPAAGAVSHRMSTLTWTPVEGASYYKLNFRKKGAIAAFTELPIRHVYPAGEDTLERPFDEYEWAVSAYRADHTKIGSTGPSSWFKLVPFPAVSGWRAALTGQTTDSPSTSCASTVADPCLNMRQTPVLRWDPVPGAGLYKLYVSRDKELTNLVTGYPRYVDNTSWSSFQALFDSQAGEAFYVSVSPCVTKTICNPPIHAPWSFNKRSNPVELLSPVHNTDPKLSDVGDDITFTWRDYLETNSDPAFIDATGVQARIEARQYRVEVSTVPNFQTVLDKIDVDQTTYTAFTRTYPEGILYWRVSAIDGSGNVLTSSAPRAFYKKSPTPSLSSPTGGATVTQTEPFRWAPLAFAASYDIEVYKNADTIGQPDNRVVVGNSKQVAFTTVTPLPASDLAYTWRLRRVDASGRKGEWTELSDPGARFFVSGTKPGLTGPTGDTTLAGDDTLFTWLTVDGASSYRFERRLAGATSMAEVVTTPALAYAPTRTIGDGEWQWRVSTLDATGKVMATSAWRSFTVDATGPTVTSRSPLTRAGTTANFIVKFSEPVSGVSTATFRLYLKGVPDPVPAVVKVNAAGTKAVLDPKRRLKIGKKYTAKLTTGITDGAGNSLLGVKWRVTAR